MAAGLADAIRAVVNDKGISEDLILKIIEEFLLAAYKRKFGHSDNAVVQFTDDGNDVTLFAQKRIVEEVDDPVTEIALEEAVQLNDECEIGDQLLIEINPQEFDRVAIQSAKQKAKQRIREIQKDTLYSEFSEKVGELVIGYCQRERNGNLYVDLGKSEGILPKRYQSPREVYRANDRIKALIVDVEKGTSGLQIILSRTHTELVKRIFELEVPEIYGKTVEIMKIVREPGYRTKIAVYSHREDVDPVGACVGLRGVRIQAIVRELEGEKIDILKYDPDPRIFIRNALSPAEVSNVVILDEAKRQALAIVPESQLSLAIGKQGLNVRLANRLADWNIDVKTVDQFMEMDLAADSKRAVSQLFGESEEEEEITTVAELPGISPRLAQLLERAGIRLIEELVATPKEEIERIQGVEPADVVELSQILAENVEIVEPGDEGTAETVEDEAELDDSAESEADEAPADETSADEEEDLYDEDEGDVITTIAELPNMTADLVEKLAQAGITELEDLVEIRANELDNIPGITTEEARILRTILTEAVEIVEQGDEEDE